MTAEVPTLLAKYRATRTGDPWITGLKIRCDHSPAKQWTIWHKRCYDGSAQYLVPFFEPAPHRRMEAIMKLTIRDSSNPKIDSFKDFFKGQKDSASVVMKGNQFVTPSIKDRIKMKMSSPQMQQKNEYTLSMLRRSVNTHVENRLGLTERSKNMTLHTANAWEQVHKVSANAIKKLNDSGKFLTRQEFESVMREVDDAIKFFLPTVDREKKEYHCCPAKG